MLVVVCEKVNEVNILGFLINNMKTKNENKSFR